MGNACGKIAARAVPKFTRLLASCSAVQSFCQIHNITARDRLPPVVFHDLDKVSESIQGCVRRRFFPGSVNVSRCVDRALNCAFRDAEDSTEPFHMFRLERFGVGETILVMKPNPHCGLRNLNSPGEFGVRNPPATARNVNQLLKWRVRMNKWDQPAS